nr:MAG TPA: hypothetical protein [Caudoviricetes sp.]
MRSSIFYTSSLITIIIKNVPKVNKNILTNVF